MQSKFPVTQSMVTNAFLSFLLYLSGPSWPGDYLDSFCFLFFSTGRQYRESLSLSSSPLLRQFTQTLLHLPRQKWLKDIFHLDTFPNLWLCLTTYRAYILLCALNTCMCVSVFGFELCIFCFLFFCYIAVNTQQFTLTKSGTSTKLSLMTSTPSIKNCTQRFMQHWKSLTSWRAWCATCLETCPVRRSVILSNNNFLFLVRTLEVGSSL